MLGIGECLDDGIYEVGEGKKLCTYVVCICQLRVVWLL